MALDYWNNHGWLLLIGLALFPRLTLLFSSIASGGLFWWLGWLVCPHLLVAILAIPYVVSNPFLVAAAWFMALFGTGAESAYAEGARR